MKEKITIKNRKGMKMAVLLEKAEGVEVKGGSKGLVFVLHGHGGNKDQRHVKMFAQAFLEKGYDTVRFDTTNTFGESEGKYEDATATTTKEDLEDVIKWASKQKWYREPFVLVGHSLGGLAVGLYAESHPEKIRGLAPIATVVSGKLSMELYPEEKKEWKKTGWNIKESSTTPGLIKKCPWSYTQDKMQYDLLSNASKLTMPVLLIVGTEDTSCPVYQQKILFQAMPEPKEIHVIQEAPHTYVKEKDIKKVKDILLKWTDKI